MLATGGALGLAVGLRQSPASGAPRRAGASADTSDPAELSIVELMPLLGRRQLSARELVDSCIARIEVLDPTIKAFKLPTFELARMGALAIDKARARGRRVGPLAGIPIGIKDTFYTKGIPTTACSRVLADFVPGHDCTAWARLQGAGMVLLGKLNCTEFAYGTVSWPTRNPWDTTRSPGGSSGGSGAALAARMVPAALGGDTGGSIVIPAAACGVAGLKATYGRVSRHGGVVLAWSLDHVGPMTRRMADSAALLQVMAGHDPADPTSLRAAVPDYPTAAPRDLAGVRVGIPDGFWDEIAPEVATVARDGVERLAAMGARIVEVPAPASTDVVMGRGPNPYGSLVVNTAEGPPLSALETVVLAEATSYHRRLAAQRPHLYAPEVLADIKAGETVSAADYLDAQRLRSVWIREWKQIFAEHRLDVVAHPVLPTPPLPAAPTQSFLAGVSFRLTKAWNLCGFPEVSVPVGLDTDNLPVGLLLAAPPLAEPRLLRTAIALDEDVQFYRRRPPVLEGS